MTVRYPAALLAAMAGVGIAGKWIHAPGWRIVGLLLLLASVVAMGWLFHRLLTLDPEGSRHTRAVFGVLLIPAATGLLVLAALKAARGEWFDAASPSITVAIGLVLVLWSKSEGSSPSAERP